MDETGGACSTNGRNKKFVQNLFQNLT